MTITRRLSRSDVTDMVAHFIWVPGLYRTYCNDIKEEHFMQIPLHPDEDETCLLYIWGGLKKYYEAQGTKEVPDKSRLEVYIRSYLRSVDCDEEAVEDKIFGDDPTMSFLPCLYDEERQSLDYASGSELAQQFLLERAITNQLLARAEELKDFLGYVDTNEAEHLRKMADEASRIEAISAEIEIQPLAPDLSIFKRNPDQRIVPSGVPFIDTHINKGQRYGEVNGLLGPTGSGKTTLGCQLFVYNVKEAFKECDEGIDNRLCVYFTYEQSAYEVQRSRILSCAFNIARSSLDSDDPESSFTRGSARHDYENNNSFGKLSEYDRYHAEKDLFNRHGIIRNMSGVPDPWDDAKQIQLKQNKGRGGVDEIVHELDYITGKRNQGVRAVFIDYMGLVIERQYMNRDEKERWAIMKNFGDAIRQKVAGAFNCTVWLLHQMSGVANSRNSTVPLRHTDASGCKSIADNMANCLCLGNPDCNKCLYLTFSKTRNAGSGGFEDQNLILQLDPVFSKFNDVSERYEPDRGNNCFTCSDGGYF